MTSPICTSGEREPASRSAPIVVWRLHDLPLVVGERARLAQDRVGDRDLADVVHRARVAQDLGLFGIQAGREREPVAQLAHPADVVAGLLVARLDGLAEPLDDLELGGAQLARADADLLLEQAG